MDIAYSTQSLRHAPRQDSSDDNAPIEFHQLRIGWTIASGQDQFLHHRIVEHKTRERINLAARRNGSYHKHGLSPLSHQRVNASHAQGCVAMQTQLHLAVNHHAQVLFVVPLLHIVAQLQLMIHTHLFVGNIVAVLSQTSAEFLQFHHIVHALMVQTRQLGRTMQFDDRPYHQPNEDSQNKRIERILHPPQVSDSRQFLTDCNHVANEHQHNDAQNDCQSQDNVSFHFCGLLFVLCIAKHGYAN